MRTRAEIKREIVDAFISNEEMQQRYGFDPNQSFESQFSLVSYENVLFEIIAFSHYILEQIFGVHKRELDELIASKKLRSEEHTSELQSRGHLVCRLLLAKK